MLRVDALQLLTARRADLHELLRALELAFMRPELRTRRDVLRLSLRL
jgi:hypothetical protein